MLSIGNTAPNGNERAAHHEAAPVVDVASVIFQKARTAREAYQGNVGAAVNALFAALRDDEEFLEIALDTILRDYAHEIIGRVIRTERDRAYRSPASSFTNGEAAANEEEIVAKKEHAKQKELEQREVAKMRVEARKRVVAREAARRFIDEFTLPRGVKKLGDAVRADLIEAAKFYGDTSAALDARRRFLMTLAARMPKDGVPVREVLTDAEVLQVRDGTKGFQSD